MIFSLLTHFSPFFRLHSVQREVGKQQRQREHIIPLWEQVSIPSAARRELGPAVLQGHDGEGASHPDGGKHTIKELVAAVVLVECITSSVRIHCRP